MITMSDAISVLLIDKSPDYAERLQAQKEQTMIAAGVTPKKNT
jgi:hypothetical protein